MKSDKCTVLKNVRVNKGELFKLLIMKYPVVLYTLIIKSVTFFICLQNRFNLKLCLHLASE